MIGNSLIFFSFTQIVYFILRRFLRRYPTGQVNRNFFFQPETRMASTMKFMASSFLYWKITDNTVAYKLRPNVQIYVLRLRHSADKRNELKIPQGGNFFPAA